MGMTTTRRVSLLFASHAVIDRTVSLPGLLDPASAALAFRGAPPNYPQLLDGGTCSERRSPRFGHHSCNTSSAGAAASIFYIYRDVPADAPRDACRRAADLASFGRQMDKAVHIQVAANGFTRITTFSVWRSVWLRTLLMFRYGFRREGHWVPAVTDDNAIYPDFVRGRKRILAGWDIWFGYDLLAEDEESDAFLKGFCARHCRKGHSGDQPTVPADGPASRAPR